MVLSDVWWFRYYTNGSIIPVDGLIKQLDIKIGRLPAVPGRRLQVRRQAVGAPYGRSTPLFYYNKDHFKAAGLPDRAPKTWQRVRRLGSQAQGQLRRPVRLHYPALAGYAGWTLQNKLWGWGGGWSNGMGHHL